MQVTTGQISYETSHLLNKLRTRDALKFTEVNNKKTLVPHPMFTVVKGEIEKWEIIQ
jgi:hypothetical protein